jgi:hypothetical protein
VSNGEGGKGKKPKKDPRKPDIPDTAPVDLIDFVDCKGATVTLKKGKAKWLPKLPEVDISFEEGTEAGSITITVAYGFVSVSIPASVKDGQLSVDTGKFPNVPPFSGAKKATQEWVDKFNAWLKLNGHKLDPPTLKEGSVTLAKSALAAGAPAKAAAAPKAEEPAKPGIKAGVGMKAAVGTGAFVLGLGLGGFLSPETGAGESVIPGGPVPVEEVAAPEPQTQEVVALPPGPVEAQITITGAPGSFDTNATFQQEGTKLVFIVPGNPPFTGTIDQQGAFSVDNQVGSFDGTFEGDQVTADHVYQGEPFTMTGTLTVPIVKETDIQPNEVFTWKVSETVIQQQPAGSTSDDGANVPAVAGGGILAVLGAGLLLIDRPSRRDCSKERAKLETYLEIYQNTLAEVQRLKERLENAEDVADRVIGEPSEGEALSKESDLGDDFLDAKRNLLIDEDNVGDAEDDLAECEGRAPRDLSEVLGETTAEVM